MKKSSKTKKPAKKPTAKPVAKARPKAMASKPKKAQVKVPAAKLLKAAAQKVVKAVTAKVAAPKKGKSLPKPAPKSAVMNTKAPAPKAAPKAELKSGKKGASAKAAAPVATVAAVLTKNGKEKPAKAPKLTKAAKLAAATSNMCREATCENQATTKGYCRLDYIKNWKKIKRKEMILKEGKLNQYIEELVGKYPDKYMDVIRQDLSTEVNFTKVIHDLELDESIDDLEYDGDSIDALIGGIKKDAEDIGGDDEF